MLINSSIRIGVRKYKKEQGDAGKNAKRASREKRKMQAERERERSKRRKIRRRRKKCEVKR